MLLLLEQLEPWLEYTAYLKRIKGESKNFPQNVPKIERQIIKHEGHEGARRKPFPDSSMQPAFLPRERATMSRSYRFSPESIRLPHIVNGRTVAQNSSKTITYADAGVNIDQANRTKQRIKYLAHKTFTKGVLSEIGGFGGLFAVDKKKYRDPVLVSSVDGVGTKLKIAFEMKLHQTVGADLVNHCVNDIAVQGATPLFFMDYLATGKLEPEVAEKIVTGIAEACKQNGAALIGGETAEMPGFYPPGEYDLAGFIVGIVDRDRIITGKNVREGDVLLGLPSNGLHTNGYSLARKLLFTVAGYTPETYVNEIKNKVGSELMRVHKSYWPVMRKLVQADAVAAMAHITGGGITENVPRVLPKGVAASV